MSGAYAGFYFTLLYLDSDDDAVKRDLRKRAKSALNKGALINEGALNEINETSISPTISRYIKAGFYGIFKLATEQDPEEPEEEGALTWLRRAAQYLAISGNRITTIDCLFLCCRAVAAQRAELELDPEVDYCLKEAKELAKQTTGKLPKKPTEPTESDIRFQLWSAADFEVSRMREIPANRPVDGPTAKRILRIFQKEDFKRTEDEEQIFDTDIKELERAISNLNDGWRSGMPPEILGEYIQRIKEKFAKIEDDELKPVQPSDDEEEADITSAEIENDELKLSGHCAIANVRSLSGYWKEANKLAIVNWEYAKELEENEKEIAKSGSIPKWRVSVPKWMAAYTYFNTKSFLDGFETGMGRMADHWNRYYASIPEDEKKAIIKYLFKLTLNPILAMPRLLILVAALKGSPEYEERYWPAGEFDQLKPNELKSELKWVECWYKQAKDVCDKASKIPDVDSTISLDCSHAFAGFYFTLLYLDSQDAGTRAYLRRKAKGALNEIKETSTSPTISRYVRAGFYGIFKLVTEQDPEEPEEEGALRHFREAAQLSATSGTRFGIVDFLFKCCHAVAAQRVEQKKSEGYLQPEVDQYLDEAGEAAENLEHHFYSGLHAAASSEVNRMRGYTGRAKRLDAEARNKMYQTGERILRIVIDEGDSSPRASKGRMDVEGVLDGHDAYDRTRTPIQERSTMTLTRADEEVIDFIAAGTSPDNVAAFRPSEAAKRRVAELIEREKTTGLTPDETSELGYYLQLEHRMRLAKARARRHLSVE